MFNLLPEIEKAKVRKLYLMRKAVVALSLLLVVLISGSIFLLPSYILVTYRNQEVERQIESIANQSKEKNRPDLSKRLSDINNKVSSVNIPESEFAYYDLVDKIIDIKPDGVLINSFSIQNIAEKGNVKALQVQVTGIAKTRDNLVRFGNSLKADDLYKEVRLPVSSLAAETNAEFVISFGIEI